MRSPVTSPQGPRRGPPRRREAHRGPGRPGRNGSGATRWAAPGRGGPGPPTPSQGCLLPSLALPPTGREFFSLPPPDPPRAAWAQLEVAVAAAVAKASHRARSTSRPSGRQPRVVDTPTPRRCNCQSPARSPEGQPQRRRRAKVLGLRDSATVRTRTRILPTQLGKKPTGLSPLGFPSGSDSFRFPWAPEL